MIEHIANYILIFVEKHMLNFIAEIIAGMAEGTVNILIFTAVSSNKEFIRRNLIKTLAFISIYTAFTYLATIGIPGGLHGLVIFIFSVALLSFITKNNFYASTVSVLIAYIVLLTPEMISIVLALIFLKIDIGVFLQYPLLKLVLVLVTRGISFAVACLILKKRINIFKLDIFKRENSFAALSILQLMALFFAVVLPLGSKNSYSYLNSIFVCITFLVIMILSYFDYREREKILAVKEKLSAQEQYIKNLQSVVDLIRKEKHDFINHLNIIAAMCQLKDSDTVDKIERYLNGLSDNIGLTYRFYNTGNIYIDGLLAVKSIFALKNGINLDVGIDAPMNLAEVDDVHLTSIIGNIMDNAFEALAAGCCGEKGIVSLYTYMENGKYYISVSNNGPEILVQEREKIFENKYSTKDRGITGERGFGLFIARELTEKAGGRVAVSSMKENTEFLIELNTRKSEQEIEMPDGELLRTG